MRTKSALVALLLVATATSVGIPASTDKASAIESLLGAYHDAGAFNGTALVADSGTVIVKKGYGLADFEWQIPNTPDTKFRLGSITKQFTATLVMQLVEEGRLTVETPLSEALPWYRKDTGARITIHQLLNHTSGIPSYTGLPDFMSEISRDPYEVRAFVEKFCSGELEFDPGTRFRYNNSGYFILGAVIEQLRGQPYRDVLKTRIFDPLGMKDSGYDLGRPLIPKRARAYESSPAGIRNADYLDMSLPFAAGALYSTVEDLAIWDQAVHERKLLSSATWDRMFTPGMDNYGYGWVIDKQPLGPGKAQRVTIGHGGGINGFSTLMRRLPEDRRLVILLNNTGGTNLRAISDGIMDVLYGREPAPPKRAAAPILYKTIEQSGVAAAVAEYRELAKTRPPALDLSEGQLDRLGSELLEANRTTEAIEIFKLNVETFPASANTHDSLAEAYTKAGMKELAVRSYAKALDLNPSNRRVVEKLNELTTR